MLYVKQTLDIMPFQQGNKLGGRKAGSQNKATTKVREAFTNLLEDNLQQLREDFKELEPKDRIKLFMELSKYVIPQLKSTEIKGDPDNPVFIPKVTFVKSE